MNPFERPGPRPFENFLPRLSPSERCLADAWQSVVAPELTDGDWALLGAAARWKAEETCCPDPLLYPPALSQRHQPRRRSTTATPTRPGAVELTSGDDPLKQVAPDVYVEALTGEVVPPNGFIRCPLPDHEDKTPSFQVLSSHWRCFGCGRGGGVIDLAAALYGIEPRGRGYREIRERIAAEFGLRTGPV